MRILLSAFACSPRWGSEPGVGWNWAVELAKDHDVTVLTHAYFRAHFEALPASQLPARLHIEYVAVDPPAGRFHEQLLNSQLYYAWWQWFAYRHARQLLRTQSFDLVHHLTLGTFRYPIFLGLLGTPLAVGPLGGGERAPSRFYAGLPLRDRITIESVMAPWSVNSTPFSSEPSVTPVAETNTSSLATRSSVCSTRFRS